MKCYVLTTSYEAQWNREINYTLSLFLGKSIDYEYMKYKKHKEWLKQKYCPLKEEDKRIFFTNLLDFPCIPKCIEYSGLVHGTKLDPTEPGHDPKAYQYEAPIIHGANKVFTTTEYLAKKIKQYFAIEPIVSGFPLCFDRKVDIEKKENIIVWSNRLVKTKGAEDLLDIISLLLSRRKDVRFVVTFQQFNPVYLGELRRLQGIYGERLEYHYNLPEKEYFELLGRAKVVVSTSYHDTFGTSVAFGVIHYAYPVLPNRVVFPCLYPNRYLYNSIDEAVKLIEEFIDSYNINEVAKLRESLREKYDYHLVWSRIFNELGVRKEEIEYLLPKTNILRWI